MANAEITNYAKRSKTAMAWERLKKSKTAMAGLLIFFVIVLLALFADFIGGYNEVAIKMDIVNRLKPPSSQWLMGTDQFGRDVFVRIAHGARVSLVIGFGAVIISLVIGGIIGATCGYYGNRYDNIVMRIMDIIMAIPSDNPCTCSSCCFREGYYQSHDCYSRSRHP